MENFSVSGMSCAACSARVEKAVRAVEGVTDCSVSLLTNTMRVEGTASPEQIIAAVEAAGYGAASAAAVRSEKTEDGREGKSLRNRLISSVLLLLALMYISMGHNMLDLPLPHFLSDNPCSSGLLQLLLSASILVINGKFFTSGCGAVLHGAPNMDTLVALGSSVSFLWSTVVLFTMLGALFTGDVFGARTGLSNLWFESSAMIPTLITVGKLLESRAKGKTTDALRGLMALAPKTAVLERDGKEITVPVERVKAGDVFVLRPGSIVPVDGTVLSGVSAVDEAALTGESIPVDKTVNDPVSAGTANRSGFLRCRAERVGEETALSGIIRMVSDATATKAPIARIADKVAAVFVPTVMTVAAVTVVVWLLLGEAAGFALARGISVLVISCPCALGLATPVAIMVGSGMGAKNGILFKNAAALETAGRIRVVALDKTGTLTEGLPSVTDVLLAEGASKSELLHTAAALEQHSEHPLAKAVLHYVNQNRIVPGEIASFEALPGFGVKGEAEGETLLGGNAALLAGSGVSVPEGFGAGLREQGKTPLFYAKAGNLLGVIAVADTLKPDSREAISALRGMGIRTVMLTGDNEITAGAIAAEAGIDEVIAGVLPGEKAAAVRRLSSGGKVCMVGDGINDAVALTASDLGMAIGAGTQIAVDAAETVLLQSRLSDAVTALKLGRETLKNIRENLFWAFFYNIIGIPIAAGVFSGLGLTISPMLGAAAMSLSSFCVVSNALRLNRFRPFNPAVSSLSVVCEPVKAGTQHVSMKIEGMMCCHCEAAVRGALEKIPGVTVLSVSHEAGTAELERTASVTDDALRAAVTAEDYAVLGIIPD